MKRKVGMKNLDCANCAAKMEAAILKIDGVQSANVSFLTQKLTIEAEEEQMEEILNKVERICRKIEPDCKVLR